jgi:hypothetical protein
MFARLSIILVTIVAQCFWTASAYTKTGGALAVVWGQGAKFHGFSSVGSAAKNRKEAIRKCGNQRCEIAQEYHKGQCAVLVLGIGQIFWNGGKNGDVKVFKPRNTVRKDLLAHCNRIDDRCQIILTECY